jgi:hypothetical protein
VAKWIACPFLIGRSTFITPPGILGDSDEESLKYKTILFYQLPQFLGCIVLFCIGCGEIFSLFG